jgi:hypothetical protein
VFATLAPIPKGKNIRWELNYYTPALGSGTRVQLLGVDYTDADAAKAAANRELGRFADWEPLGPNAWKAVLS